MLFNESCSKGQLQVTDTTVQVISPFQKVVWSVPRQAITYIALKKGPMMADLTIYTATNHFPANFMAPHKARQFLTFFPGIPGGPATHPQVYVPAIAQDSQWPSAPTAPFQVPARAGAKKKPPVWAYVVSFIIVLGFCGSAGVAGIVSAVSNNASQVQVATPTDTPASTGQRSTLAATVVTGDTPTPAPTQAPTPTAKPTLPPTPKPVPTRAPATPTPCPGINCNPWGYNFSPGTLIYTPPSGFCSYFNCIASFYSSDDPGDGFIIQCQDGTYSQSGGERGACSSHGGEARPLYAH